MGTTPPRLFVFERDALQAGREEAGTPALLRSKDEQHKRLRRTLKQQEPLIKKYAEMLISVLNRRAGLQHNDLGHPDARIDMVEMYHFTTLDVCLSPYFDLPS